MKIRPAGIELFHANRQTDRHDGANSRFSQFANAPKNRFSLLGMKPLFLDGSADSLVIPTEVCRSADSLVIPTEVCRSADSLVIPTKVCRSINQYIQ
jgi:hypothetical protein